MSQLELGLASGNAARQQIFGLQPGSILSDRQGRKRGAYATPHWRKPSAT